MGDAIKGVFRSLENIGSENELTEYKAQPPQGRAGGQVSARLLKWNAVTLKQGITDDFFFWKWRELGQKGDMKEARKRWGCSPMHNIKGEPAAKWEFSQCLAALHQRPGPDATNSEVAVDRLEIVCEGYKRVPITGPDLDERRQVTQ